jgi:multicomponent Na+:H+ antiporter subunit D
MISPEQYPVVMIVVPLLAAFVINIAGLVSRRLCYPILLLALGITTAAAVAVLEQVIRGGAISYRLGGWPPPMGIEYVVDHLNALILAVTAAVAFLAAVFSKRSVEQELPDKIPYFYTLFILAVVGLLGMTITGDAFNLYVLMEITALTNYALIAAGRADRAPMASFTYIIIGTIGASFYLLGVGHLYIMTGSLNMADLRTILPDLYGTHAVIASFVILLLGIWIKMAFFPLHSWLPNAYTYAPTATSCLIAPLVTKVSIYIMARLMFSVYSSEFSYQVFGHAELVVWLAVVAIVAGSLLALSQKDFKKMLTYLIVAEVGYMVGGLWLANRYGITGAVLHIVNDALMTLCLFFTAGIVAYKMKGHAFTDLQGLYRKMPLTMAAFTVGVLSMIGVPPTAGFFSKWYLLLGAIDAGQWGFLGALLFSSLMNAVLFFKVIEIAYFEPYTTHHGHGHGGSHAAVAVDEAPFSMLAPLVLVSLGLLVVGFYSGFLVTNIIQFAVPAGL